MPVVLEPGREVGGRYELDHPLGEGGMGEVWAAHHKSTNRPVALKFLKGGVDADARRRLLKEARAASAVKHPAVVAVEDVIDAEGEEPALAMELLIGESLGARLVREGVLSSDVAAKLLLPVADAMVAAHAAGVVHRDLKPDNVFITRSGDVRVLDFGVAKRVLVDHDTAQSIGTISGALIGTPMFMSPEQAFAEKDIDHRTDIWSLGLVLYQCLTGVLPTRAENLGQVLKVVLTGSFPPVRDVTPSVPRELASLVDRMLCREREDRPQTMKEVASVLSAIALAAGPATNVIVRVNDSDSEDAWAVTQTPSEGGPLDSASDADAFLREMAATSKPAAQAPEPDRTGQRVAHYDVVRKIGQGGMGIVYAADDVRLRRRVALKVLPVGFGVNEDRRRRFLREARSASAVHHPNVATVFDVGESEGTVFLAMEYVDGVTLRKLLEQRGGRLETLEGLTVAIQITRGLARAHEAGIIHRDVKPENVMVAADGTAKVLDFGLAKVASAMDEPEDVSEIDPSAEDFASRTGHVLGTPAYMSPEQAAGSRVDMRTDVYAMGVVLHEMLLGTRPSKTNRKAGTTSGSRIVAPIARIIDRCLRESRDERYPHAGALYEDLRKAADVLAPKPSRRSSLFVAIAILGVGGLAAAAWQLGNAPRSKPEEVSVRREPSPPSGTAIDSEATTGAGAVPIPTQMQIVSTAQPSASEGVGSATRPQTTRGGARTGRPRAPDPLSQQK